MYAGCAFLINAVRPATPVSERPTKKGRKEKIAYVQMPTAALTASGRKGIISAASFTAWEHRAPLCLREHKSSKRNLIAGVAGADKSPSSDSRRKSPTNRRIRLYKAWANPSRGLILRVRKVSTYCRASCGQYRATVRRDSCSRWSAEEPEGWFRALVAGPNGG